MYSIKAYKNIRYLVIDELNNMAGVRHAFSAGNGGIIGDLYKNAQKNRKLFKEALCIDSKEITTVNQVHGNDICIIDDSTVQEEIKTVKADAMITDKKGIPIGILTADCIPVLLFDKEKKVIAAIHAGREGTVKEITKKVIHTMAKRYNSSSTDMLAAIGPGIGRCCYSISESIAERVKKYLLYWQEIIDVRNKEVFLDIERANRFQLKSSGVPDKNIFSVDLCTCCNSDLFFSYRREQGKTGRMISMIMRH